MKNKKVPMNVIVTLATQLPDSKMEEGSVSSIN